MGIEGSGGMQGRGMVGVKGPRALRDAQPREEAAGKQQLQQGSHCKSGEQDLKLFPPIQWQLQSCLSTIVRHLKNLSLLAANQA